MKKEATAERALTLGEISVTTWKYYGVTGGADPGIYLTLAKAQSAVHGQSNKRYQGFDTLASARTWFTDQGVDVSKIKIFQSHFAQFPTFEPTGDRPFEDEFQCLAQSQGWIPNSQQYKEERTIAIKKEIQNEYWEPALKEEELSQLTPEDRTLREDEWNLCGYQALIQEVGGELRDSIQGCIQVLQNTYVNIVDLLDAPRTGVKAEVFSHFNDFRKYTMQPGKRVDLEMAKKDKFLSTLLQRLRGPRALHRRHAPLRATFPATHTKSRGPDGIESVRVTSRVSKTRNKRNV